MKSRDWWTLVLVLGLVLLGGSIPAADLSVGVALVCAGLGGFAVGAAVVILTVLWAEGRD